jgi:glycosyltransferase involved in cell wall biosynthesis
VTINDTIPWTQSDPTLPPGFYRDRLLPAAYARASALVAISDCSRRDIVALWPHLTAKVHVVPLGVDERYLGATMESGPTIIGESTVTGPYLLYFGGSDPRKRLDWALDVWRAVAATGLSLVVCGLEATSHDRVRRSIPRELSDRLILAPFVPENTMPRLYMRAAAVLYPSLYEGFGLPALEAQAVGTPVLFSDVGSLSELKGPGAHVLPIGDMGAWIRAVSGIACARATSPRPDADARQWARRFSWDVYAQRIVAVYRSITRLGPGNVRLAKRTVDEAAL